MNNNLEIRVINNDWWNGFRFMIRDRGRTHYAELIMKPYDPGTLYPTESNTILDERAVQLLMDDLWQCGVRPTNKVGTVGQLQATEKHLDDMRNIAFNRLGIEVVK